MPLKRRKPRPRRRIEVSEGARAFLTGGPIPADANQFELHALEFDHDYARSRWLACREEVLEEWVAKHPGTRPRAWWRFDSPIGRPHFPTRQLETACLRRLRQLTDREREALGLTDGG